MKTPILLTVTYLASTSPGWAEAIAVTAENFARAETAWNFTNWARKGADKEILHLREVSPVGAEAPTVRMNWDTLYSIQIIDVSDDHEFAVNIPDSDLYVSAQIMDEDGFSPYFIVEPGAHTLTVSTDFAFVMFRTELKDRTDAAALVHLHDVQDMISVSGYIENSPYVSADYDQEQLESLRITYKEEFLKAGNDYTYAKAPGEVDQHLLDISHAAGWGGYPPELGVSNAYSSSPALPGDECLGITFDDPENKFFTSFTLYDVDGYLMEGNTHINSNMWEPNSDGTITVQFNCEDNLTNSLSSGGEPFNYSVRNYGVSQVVLDGSFRPISPEPFVD